LINFFLADYFQNVNEYTDNSFPEETIGLLKFSDRTSAERTLEWIKKRVRKGHKGEFPIFESEIRGRLGAGRFEIGAYSISRRGVCERVC
jgi:hypothetical protein